MSEKIKCASRKAALVGNDPTRKQYLSDGRVTNRVRKTDPRKKIGAKVDEKIEKKRTKGREKNGGKPD